MESFDEFYNAAKQFDDFLEQHNENIEDSYLLGQSVLMYHGEKSGLEIDYRKTDDFDLAVPNTNTAKNLGNYGMFYGGETNIQFDDFNVDILSNPSHPTVSEIQEDWSYGDDILEFDNYSPKVMSPQLFHDSKVRMAESETERDKDREDVEKITEIIDSLE